MLNYLDIEDVLTEKYDGLLETKNALQYMRDALCYAIKWLNYEDSEGFATSMQVGICQTALNAVEKQLRAVQYLMRKNDLEYDIGVYGADNIRPYRTAGFFD